MVQSWSLPTPASPTALATPTRTSLSAPSSASSAQPTAAPPSLASSPFSLHPAIPASLASQLALFAQHDPAPAAGQEPPATTWSPSNDEERAALAALLQEQQEDNMRYMAAGKGERWEERRRAPTSLDQEARRGLRDRRSLPFASTLGKRQSAEGCEFAKRMYYRTDSADPRLPQRATDPDCSNEGNGVLSCFPFSNTTLVDNVWSKFIWNARYPTFIGAGSVLSPFALSVARVGERGARARAPSALRHEGDYLLYSSC
jgi:hypothetical protein